MTRAYALGVAAGTQALFLIRGSIIFGFSGEPIPSICATAVIAAYSLGRGRAVSRRTTRWSEAGSLVTSH